MRVNDAPTSMPETSLLVGGCQVVVTPPIGTTMAGYIQRTEPARGIADDLILQALVLRYGEDTLVLVSLDALYVDAAFARSLATDLNLSEDRVIVVATHTHSGPRLDCDDKDGAAKEPNSVRDWWLRQAIGVVQRATRRARPAIVTMGSIMVEGVSGNRNDPTIQIDRELIAVGLRDAGTQALLAALVNFACHPTVLGADNLLFSPDFVGSLRRVLNHVSGSHDAVPESPIILFLNGAAGNVSTRFFRREQTSAEAERIGTLIGNAARAALANAVVLSGNLSPTTARVVIPLARRVLPDAVASATAIAIADAAYQEALREQALPAALRILRTRYEGAILQERQRATDQGEAEIAVSVTGWRLGALALVALPGELFSSLGQKIKRALISSTTLVVGYGNGNVGYIPDAAAYQADTYEVLSTRFASGAGERLSDRVIRFLQEDLR